MLQNQHKVLLNNQHCRGKARKSSTIAETKYIIQNFQIIASKYYKSLHLLPASFPGQESLLVTMEVVVHERWLVMGKRWPVTEVAEERGELGGVCVRCDKLQQHRVAVRRLVGHASNLGRTNQKTTTKSTNILSALELIGIFSGAAFVAERGKEEETGLVE